MSDITVIILTKNEEKNIKASIISSKQIAERIIVVDSGSNDKTIEIANIDIKKQYTIFYGEFRYCLILHFDKKTTSFFLPNDCFKWFLAGNNDKITCIHDGKAAFILFSECL